MVHFIIKMDTLDSGVLQYIQDCEPSAPLYLVYKCVNAPSQKKFAVDMLKKNKLFSKNLRNIRGSYASVMFAYSSGDLEHLLATVPLNKFSQTRNPRMSALLHSGNLPYKVRMRFYKAVMYVKDFNHYVLLK